MHCLAAEILASVGVVPQGLSAYQIVHCNGKEGVAIQMENVYIQVTCDNQPGFIPVGMDILERPLVLNLFFTTDPL